MDPMMAFVQKQAAEQQADRDAAIEKQVAKAKAEKNPNPNSLFNLPHLLQLLVCLRVLSSANEWVLPERAEKEESTESKESSRGDEADQDAYGDKYGEGGDGESEKGCDESEGSDGESVGGHDSDDFDDDDENRVTNITLQDNLEGCIERLKTLCKDSPSVKDCHVRILREDGGLDAKLAGPAASMLTRHFTVGTTPRWGVSCNCVAQMSLHYYVVYHVLHLLSTNCIPLSAAASIREEIAGLLLLTSPPDDTFDLCILSRIEVACYTAVEACKGEKPKEDCLFNCTLMMKNTAEVYIKHWAVDEEVPHREQENSPLNLVQLCDNHKRKSINFEAHIEAYLKAKVDS